MESRHGEAARPALAQRSEVRLGDGADERHHDLDVAQPHVVTHALNRITLQRKAVTETVGDIATGTPEAEHWIFLFRLVTLTADQVGILIGFEVRKSHNYPFRCKSGPKVITRQPY